MKTDLELLDSAYELTGSDSETARRVGMHQGNISDVRNGRRELSAAQAGQIAELIGQPWIDEAFPRLAKNEKSRKSSGYWLGKLKTLHAIALLGAMAGFWAMIPQNGVGYSVASPTEGAFPACILCEVIGQFLTILAVVIICSVAPHFAQKRRLSDEASGPFTTMS